jgi:hypothetical protein
MKKKTTSIVQLAILGICLFNVAIITLTTFMHKIGNPLGDILRITGSVLLLVLVIFMFCKGKKKDTETK